MLRRSENQAARSSNCASEALRRQASRRLTPDCHRLSFLNGCLSRKPVPMPRAASHLKLTAAISPRPRIAIPICRVLRCIDLASCGLCNTEPCSDGRIEVKPSRLWVSGSQLAVAIRPRTAQLHRSGGLAVGIAEAMSLAAHSGQCSRSNRLGVAPSADILVSDVPSGLRQTRRLPQKHSYPTNPGS